MQAERSRFALKTNSNHNYCQSGGLLCRYKKWPVPVCPIRGTESPARHCCIKIKSHRTSGFISEVLWLNSSIEVRDHNRPLNYSLSDHTPKHRVHYPVQVCQAFCPYKEALRYLLPCCLFQRTFQVPCPMRRALCALTRNSFEL